MSSWRMKNSSCYVEVVQASIHNRRRWWRGAAREQETVLEKVKRAIVICQDGWYPKMRLNISIYLQKIDGEGARSVWIKTALLFHNTFICKTLIPCSSGECEPCQMATAIIRWIEKCLENVSRDLQPKGEWWRRLKPSQHHWHGPKWTGGVGPQRVSKANLVKEVGPWKQLGIFAVVIWHGSHAPLEQGIRVLHVSVLLNKSAVFIHADLASSSSILCMYMWDFLILPEELPMTVCDHPHFLWVLLWFLFVPSYTARWIIWLCWHMHIFGMYNKIYFIYSIRIIIAKMKIFSKYLYKKSITDRVLTQLIVKCKWT